MPHSSGNDDTSCVEVAITPRTVHVRDSKHVPGRGPRLALPPESWAAFVSQLR